jgi:hypothetical protein
MIPDTSALTPGQDVIIWRRYPNGDHRHIDIPALFLGLDASRKLRLRALSIRDTPVGRVLFTVDQPVAARSCMTLAQWWAQSAQEHRNDEANSNRI